MDRFLLFLSLILLISASESNGAQVPSSPAQAYWEKVLPKTPMPSAIRDLIGAENTTEDPTKTTVDDGKARANKGTTVTVGRGGVSVNSRPNGKPKVIVNVSPFYYMYAATDTQIHDDPRVAFFFLEEDLHPGAKMTLNFKKTAPTVTFIPRAKANSIPFSSASLPEILSRFAISPGSQEAETMKRTLEECEMPAVEGESKQCATSLESMVEFSTKSLGTRSLAAMSTTVGNDGTKEQEYTIKKSGAERITGNKMVTCHLQAYQYAVFYCHVPRKSKAYTVKMVASNGSDVEAVAVCHSDTAAWNPKHVAFRVLGVKPGAVPVCHFLPQDHVLWAAKN